MSEENTSPTNIIKVSLDTSVQPHVLKVTDNGNNDIPRKAGEQRIRWTLVGDLANCKFVSMTECRPGFEWLSWPAPPPHVFGTATIGGNGTWVEITDIHEDAASAGVWLYRLRVRCDGSEYEPVLGVESRSEPKDSPSYAKVMVGNNPIIINR